MTSLRKPNRILILFVKFIGFFLFHIYFRIEIRKKDNFPDKDPFIVVANHTSFLDSILIGYAVPKLLYHIAKSELFRNKIFAFIIGQLGALSISRNKKDGFDLIRIINVIKSGGSILIFPEGTRSVSGEMLKPKPGIGFIIAHSDVPVIPVFIKDAHRCCGKKMIFVRPKKISINIGKSMTFKEGSYEEIADSVMDEIKRLKSDIE